MKIIKTTFKLILPVLIAGTMFAGCSSDNEEIGAPIPLEPPYPLPEKGLSPAQDRVVDFYYNYNTFLLYDFTPEDFDYGQSTNGMEYHATVGDLQYLEPMLDLLDEVWLDFFPESFKSRYFPFKIYFADQISTTNKWSGVPTYYDLVARKTDMAVAGMNESINEITPEKKQELKCALIGAYIDFLLIQQDADGTSLLKIPQEFYEVTDYANDWMSSLDYKASGNPDVYLEFGYLPDLDFRFSAYPSISPGWAMSKYVTDATSDIKHFMKNLFTIGDDFPQFPDFPASGNYAPYENRITWNYYLQKDESGNYKFPRIKKKYDILMKYFTEELGIDVTAMRNKRFDI